MAINTDHKFKIILLGESGVGKTAMTHKYTNTTFKSNHSVVNLTSKELTVKEKKVELCIWETSSQKWFQNVAPNYYDGILLVYDTTDMQTFDALSDWLTQLRKRSNGAVALVVGNKIDHPDSTAVSRDLVMRFTRDEDLNFMESSAKNGNNVIEIFEYLTLKILQAKSLVPMEESNCESSTPFILPVHDQTEEQELASEQFQQLDAPFIRTVHDHSDEHEFTIEQLQQPDTRNSSNDSKHETIETLQTPRQTTCRLNGNLNTSQAADSDDDDLELSFVWVSFLPPIVKLPPDITPLQVGRRRTSADSVVGSYQRK